MRLCRQRYATARMDGGKLAPKDDIVFPDGGDDVLDFCERVAFLTRNGHLNEVQVWSVFGNWIRCLQSGSGHEYVPLAAQTEDGI